jgi:hypothetical protein
VRQLAGLKKAWGRGIPRIIIRVSQSSLKKGINVGWDWKQIVVAPVA